MAEISIKLNQNIQCDVLCHKISLLVQQSGITPNSLLVICIKEIIDSDQSLLPKIEFKNET
jgi:hypothetical protein